MAEHLSDDPTLGLSEAELWAFAARLHEVHGADVGDVFLDMFRKAMRASDLAGYERWSKLLEMVEALNSPSNPGALH